MLHLHLAVRTEDLVESLAELVAADPPGPMERETILVQSLGLERWLSRRLAERLGVWAHPDFPFPARFAERLLRLDGAARERASSADRILRGRAGLTLALGRWLGMHATSGLLPEDLGRWLGRESGPRRRLELAAELAEVFDRYQVERPEELLRWAAGEPTAEAERWQAEAWRWLAALHEGQPMPELALGLARGGIERLSEVPRRVSAFGTAALATLHRELLRALAAVSEVHVFLTHPAPGLIDRLQEDIGAAVLAERPAAEQREGLRELAIWQGEEGNALRWAPQSTEAAHLLLEADAVLHRPAAAATEPAPGDLGRLQALLCGAELAPAPRAEEAEDALLFVACAGVRRQLEVTRDLLLGAFARDPSLKASEVVVLAPEIERFAPLVEAVFSPGIPFSLADRGGEASERLSRAWLAFLELLEGRFGLSEVMDLLAEDAVRRAAGLDGEDVAFLAERAARAGVRWAVDAEHREHHGQPRSPMHTWRFGFERLLLGHALGNEEEVLCLERAPLVQPDAGAARRVGDLAEWLERLAAAEREARRARPLTEWGELLGGWLDTFLEPSEEEREAHDALRGVLKDLQEAAERVGLDEDLALRAVRERVRDGLLTLPPAPAFSGSGITFGRMVPLRAIPFRVVVLLGMEEESFPRVRPPRPWDLVAAAPRLGDRDPREDDRQLLGDLVGGAREKLWILWTGLGPDDGEERPASTYVEDLRDQLAAAAGRPAEEVAPVLQVPLHGFLPAVFRSEAGWLRGRDPAALAAARALADPKVAAVPFCLERLPAVEGPTAVALEDLIRFFEHPPKGFLTQRLGLWPERSEAEVPDREPLLLDGLEEWDARSRSVAPALLRKEPAEVEAILRAAGAWPAGPGGELAASRTQAFATSLRTELRARLGEPEPGLAIDLDLGEGWRIEGRIEGVHRRGLGRVQAGGIHEKNRLRLTIELAVAALAGGPARAVLLAKAKDAEATTAEEYEAGESAGSWLRDLLALRAEGLRRPLPWHPDPAGKLLREDDEQKALAAAASCWRGLLAPDAFRPDAAVQLAFQGWPGLGKGPEPWPAVDDGPGFVELSARIFDPVLAGEVR